MLINGPTGQLQLRSELAEDLVRIGLSISQTDRPDEFVRRTGFQFT